MNDRPTAEELLRAVERFLEARHHVVAMVAREIETADAHERGEWLRLGALLGSDDEAPEEHEARRVALLARNQELSERIRAGEADAGPWRAELLAHLRHTVGDKLEVARPPRQGRQGG